MLVDTESMQNEDQNRLGSPPRLGAANVASALNRDILEGRYLFGEQLPPERALAASVGTSRGTIRAALARLEAAGMVERIRGSGTFVLYREPGEQEHVSEITSPLELISVRLAVEPPMVRMATLNANARDLDRLSQALRRVESCRANSEDFSKFDERFHLCLAEITRNPLMVWLYRQLNEVRSQSQWHGIRDKILNRQRIDLYNDQHRRLFEAIRHREADQAAAVITEHLELARRDLTGAKMP